MATSDRILEQITSFVSNVVTRLDALEAKVDALTTTIGAVSDTPADDGSLFALAQQIHEDNPGA